ncbi:MAG: DUF3144 domain-containing protein [Cocleimonas sp.]|nr:DUF3144 domain-containing protein [Cocleimonas sp.]
MTDTDTNKQFKQIADTYIDTANQHIENHDFNLVGSAFIYGSARFSAFIVASGSQDLEQYKANRDVALEHFVGQFKQMLEENLTSYEASFVQEEKYKKYMKK